MPPWLSMVEKILPCVSFYNIALVRQRPRVRIPPEALYFHIRRSSLAGYSARLIILLKIGSDWCTLEVVGSYPTFGTFF